MKIELDSSRLLGRRIAVDGRIQGAGAKIGEAKPNGTIVVRGL